MTTEEVLQVLVMSPRLNQKQLKVIKNSLLKTAKQFHEAEYLDQQFFREALSAAIKLIFIRLRDGQDPRTCRGLWELLIAADNIDINYPLWHWFVTKISPTGEPRADRDPITESEIVKSHYCIRTLARSKQKTA